MGDTGGDHRRRIQKAVQSFLKQKNSDPKKNRVKKYKNTYKNEFSTLRTHKSPKKPKKLLKAQKF